MKRLFFKYIPVLSFITMLALPVKNLSANNPGSTLVNGIGISADYSYSADDRKDGAAYLSYRYGFIWIFSGFLTADAGYRFDKESINFKTGASGMILFGGFEAGVTGVYNRKNSESGNTGENKDRGFAPGMYLGLNGVIPVKEFPVFLSAGRSFYVKNHENEYYVMLTCIVNFED